MTIIVFSGKGGTGKTSLSALNVRYFTERDEITLALDLDPDSHLNKLLGTPMKKTLGEVLDRIHKEKKVELEPQKPVDISDQEYFLSLVFEQVLIEGDNFDLITLGKPSLDIDCYCPAYLWAEYAIPQIMKSYQVTYQNIIIDCDPGTEIFPRRILDRIASQSKIDYIMVVLDGSKMSLDTALDICKEVNSRRLNIGEILAICNRVDDQQIKQQITEIASKSGLEIAGFIPTDPELITINLQSKNIFDLPAQSASYESMKKVLQKITD